MSVFLTPENPDPAALLGGALADPVGDMLAFLAAHEPPDELEFLTPEHRADFRAMLDADE